MRRHSLQVREALHRLPASSSPKILSLISGGSVSAKFSGAGSSVIREALLLETTNTGEVLGVGSRCMMELGGRAVGDSLRKRRDSPELLLQLVSALVLRFKKRPC
ncbi:hypothetical protein EYF80_039659 [Liparis tanakae]|uniref:Uncharacterized protein n=1 Tax=Liparis tanakae TaxID=230148 RepID=A0A4Z2GAM0_9TELE|nr:hypothetical protein EYF80_039659 [Liparis tanakae]